MGLLSLSLSISLALSSVFPHAEASSSTEFYPVDPVVQGCFCPAVVVPICDLVEASWIVLRGTLLARSDGTTTSLVSSSPDLIPGVPDPVTYTVDITTLFKTDPTVRLGQQVDFVTGGAECVVDLAVGEDYLIGLYWDSDGLLRVASCGLYRRWETVQEGEVTLLASGCSEEDPCSGTCGDGQECVQYTGNGKYYCSDTCEGACEAEETCTLRTRTWCRRSTFEGCPMKHNCV